MREKYWLHLKKYTDFFVRRSSLTWLICLAMSLTGCSPAKKSQGIVFQGSIFDTTFLLRIPGAPKNPDALHPFLEQIQKKLKEIDRTCSLYKKGSELNRVNEAPGGTPIVVSPMFYDLIELSKTFFQETGGVFDPTVGPLVDAWGFGPSASTKTLSKKRIQTIKNNMGMEKIKLLSNNKLQKHNAAIQLDLNGIAKGYAVDRISDFLTQQGMKNFLIEIGGEVLAKGSKANGQPWTVGIEKPMVTKKGDRMVQRKIHLQNAAVATSGTYRQKSAGAEDELSHIIDPRTGRPVQTSVVSATVIAPLCAEADAATTALMVMKPKEGLRWIENKQRWEALLIQSGPEETFVEEKTSGWKKFEVPE